MRKPYINICFLFVMLFASLSLPARKTGTLDSLKQVYSEAKSDSVKIVALIAISKHYREINFDQATSYAFRALEHSKKYKQKSNQAMANRQIGQLYVKKGNYGSATGYYLEALEIDKELNNYEGQAADYDLIGDIYFEQGNLNESMNSYKKALGINKHINNKKGMSRNYTNMGIIYSVQDKYDNSIDCYNQALQLSEEINNKQGVAATYLNKSIVFYKKGAMGLAISNTEKAIEIQLGLADSNDLLSSYTNLGELYMQTQEFERCMQSLQSAEQYINAFSDKTYLKSFYDNYERLYRALGDYKSAFEYGSKVLRLKDSIYKESNNRQAIELTARHEAQENEKEIDDLKKDTDMASEALKQQRNFKIILFIFGLISAGFSVVLVRRVIRKRKTNKTLSSVYAQIEKKNQSITDSINYSKRIQEAILPSRKLKNKLFHDSFIIFMPKDIVSGDFYWYTEKNGKKIVACCDCTGHGVPGSLMSMIGNNILNQVVNENEITSPDEILNHLHREIRKALKQDMQSKSMDGMDLALIAFNSETEIEYAGAHRPLWIVRKKSHDAEVVLIEIKANKFSIGGYQAEEERKFTKHTITLEKGDCVYMSTDGYADQFGGPEGKKFMTKRLKELLIANYSNSIAEQEKNITNAIIDWKGDYEQVDDIQMIGIRI
ncbi:MAG: tetratricopeptide repeat protein [Bacteroidia bacterium]